jgi:hypothetical protein
MAERESVRVGEKRVARCYSFRPRRQQDRAGTNHTGLPYSWSHGATKNTPAVHLRRDVAGGELGPGRGKKEMHDASSFKALLENLNLEKTAALRAQRIGALTPCSGLARTTTPTRLSGRQTAVERWNQNRSSEILIFNPVLAGSAPAAVCGRMRGLQTQEARSLKARPGATARARAQHRPPRSMSSLSELFPSKNPSRKGMEPPSTFFVFSLEKFEIPLPPAPPEPPKLGTTDR